jgi:hypothetical protein
MEIKDTIKKLASNVLEIIKRQHNNAIKQAQAQAIQTERLKISTLMYDMTVDLFQGLGGRQYTSLVTITVPADIRVYNYVLKNNDYIYEFTISKQNMNKIAITLLQQIVFNMNRDLAQAQFRISSAYGNAMLCSAFPFLYQGVYVIGAVDVGTDVVLSVATNVTP